MDEDDLFDFGNLFDDEPEQPKKGKKEKPAVPEQRPIAIKHRMGHRHLTRKAASEKALEDNIDTWHFKDGDCYHCFSFGDVDSLTYFKMILRQQPIKYAALSTWCMAGEDILDLEKWHDKGLLGRVDLYVGEIFKGSYPEVYEKAMEFIKKENGRLVVFRNHSKVMAIKGERFDCVIESSANINTNPRSENTVVTIDSAVADFYINLFGQIIPFNKDCGADPYTV